MRISIEYSTNPGWVLFMPNDEPTFAERKVRRLVGSDTGELK